MAIVSVGVIPFGLEEPFLDCSHRGVQTGWLTRTGQASWVVRQGLEIGANALQNFI